jgi:uncharacterized protein YidB (DUF937 family)
MPSPRARTRITARPASKARAAQTLGGVQGVVAQMEQQGFGATELAGKLAQTLPQAVNKLTPNGVVQPS